MTISSTTNRNDYIGNDSAQYFNYSFRVFTEDDFEVTVKETATDTDTVLALTTDYIVYSGIGAVAGGLIRLQGSGNAWNGTGPNLDTGYELTIRRVVSLTQGTDIRNQGSFYPEAHEDVFDRLVMISQQQQDEIDRSLKLSDTVDPASFNLSLGTPEADLFIKVNAAGTGFEYVTSTVSGIINANIDADADITRTKLAPGTANHVMINTAGGEVSSEAQLATSRGGTGVNSSSTFPTSGVIATLDATQSLSNKSFSDSILLENISTPATPGAGTIKVYAKGDKFYALDDGGTETALALGGGGTGGLETFYSQDFELVGSSFFSVTGQSATPDNAGTGTMAGALATSADKAGFNGERHIQFLTSATGNNDFFLSDEIPLEENQNHRTVTVKFDYTYNGADGDLEFIAHDSTNDTAITVTNPELLDCASYPTEVRRFKASIVIPASCDNFRYGMQATVNATFKTMQFSNVEITTQELDLQQTKFLAATKFATTQLTDMSFTGMEVGKTYRISGLSQFNSGSASSVRYVISTAATGAGTAYYDTTIASSLSIDEFFSRTFTATASTLYAYFVINAGTGGINGGSGYSNNYILLEELNNLVETSKF